jgi:hypothetical protein
MAQKRTFTEVNKRIADLTIQLQKLTAEYKKLESEGKTAAEINDVLGKKIESVSKKLSTLSNVTRQYNKQVGVSNQQRKETNENLEKAVKVHTNLTSAVNKGRLAQDKANASNKTFGEGLSSVFSPAAIGRAIGSVTKFVSIYSLLQGAVNLVNAAIVGSIKAFADFENRIQRLSAVSSASAEELDVLSNSIRQTALETAFGVQEVSDLAISLAKLGVAAKDIPDLLTPVALAAQATGESLEQTGEAIVKVINQFGLSTEQTVTVASALTSAINSSTLSLDQFGTAIGYVGPLATQVGLSFEDTASFLAVLADNGFSASRAGTGLRKIFIDLKQPGEDISQTLQRLADRNIGLAQAEDLVGKTAAAQLVVLLRNLEATKDQVSASEGLTSIIIQNARANSTLTGQYNILTNTVEEFQIAIGGAITNSEILLDLIGLLSSESEKLGRGYKLLNDLNKELGDSFERDLTRQIENGGNAVQFFIQALERSDDKKLREIAKALRDADPKNLAEAERALDKIGKQETRLGRVAGTLGSIFGPAASLAASTFANSLFGVEEQAQATAGAIDILTRSQKEFNEAQLIEDASERLNKTLEVRLDRIKSLTSVTSRFNAASNETIFVNEEIAKRESAINTLSQLRTAGARERILALEGEIQGFKNYKQALSEYIDPASKVEELEKEALKRAKDTENSLKARAARLKEEIRLIEARRKAEEKAAEERKRLGLEATVGDPIATARVLAEYDKAISDSNARASASLLLLTNDFSKFATDSQRAFNNLKVGFPEIAQSIIDSTYDINDAISVLGADIDFTFGEQIKTALSNSKDVVNSYGDSIDGLQDKFKKDKKNREKYLELIETEAENTVRLLLLQKATIDQTTDEGRFAAQIIDNLINDIEGNVENLKNSLEGENKINWKEILLDGLNEALSTAAEALKQFNDVAFENTKNRLDAQRARIQAQADIENDILKSQLDNQLITEEEFRNRSEKNRKRAIQRENAIDKAIFEAEKKRDRQQATANFLQAVASSLINEILGGKPFPANAISAAITVGLAGGAYAAELSAINQRQFFPKRFAEGGMVDGPSHAEGGVPFTVRGRAGYEMEGGEFIVNKRAAALNRSLLERINNSAKPTATSGSFAYDSVSKIPSRFAQGGSVTPAEVDRATQEQLSYLRAIAESNVAVANNTGKPVRAFVTQTDLRDNDLERRILNKNSRL